jgi:hypothetical protein
MFVFVLVSSLVSNTIVFLFPQPSSQHLVATLVSPVNPLTLMQVAMACTLPCSTIVYCRSIKFPTPVVRCIVACLQI